MSEPAEPEADGHGERVEKAFDSLHETLGDRLSEESRGSVERLREAARGRDSAAMKEELQQVEQRESWLHRELVEHPDIAALINELAVWGF